jgi:hypothetical protein
MIPCVLNDLLVYRPDLVDWRQVERRQVRERIDLAFHVMDREYGVTRLLDPEGRPIFIAYGILNRNGSMYMNTTEKVQEIFFSHFTCTDRFQMKFVLV